MTFEEWKDDYGLVFEPNYSEHTEADCLAAFKAGAAGRDAEVAELNLRYEKLLNIAALRETEQQEKLAEANHAHELISQQLSDEFDKREALDNELAESQKREVMLRDALSNLRWAASERDKKNRIRQFDEFMDNANEALAATEPKP